MQRRSFFSLIALGLLIAGSPLGHAQQNRSVTLLAYGDSLTAGYGLAPEQAFPVRLEAWLKARGASVRVINGGVSGDTTAGGLARLDWSLSEKPDAALIALGANDMLRGLDPKQAETNLDSIVTRMKDRGIRVMLVGMRAAPNLGPTYVQAFEGLYPRIARKHNLPLYPFMLDGVAANAGLNLADGIHPNARGVDVMVERIGPQVLRWLRAGQG